MAIANLQKENLSINLIKCIKIPAYLPRLRNLSGMAAVFAQKGFDLCLRCIEYLCLPLTIE